MDKREQLLNLLGNGVPPVNAAAAVGVDPSYVSQLLADNDFATSVSKLRVNKLQDATNRDSSYDKLEDKLLQKLEDTLPFMVKPMDILKSIQVVNAAKRRGAGEADNRAAQTTNIVVLQLPGVVKQRFQKNLVNEVIEVDGRTLLTIDSNKLLTEAKATSEARKQLTDQELAAAAI